jgi:pimeloyl-ACP methyl ester carboxylesterase
MFPGIHIPKFLYRRKRIAILLREAEALSTEELRREEVLARLFKNFSSFLHESREEKIQEELRNELNQKNRNEVLRTYFGRILNILMTIRSIIKTTDELNKRILGNMQEINSLAKQHARSRWLFISTKERAFFYDFRKLCDKRHQDVTSVDNLLRLVLGHIDEMIRVVNGGLSNKDNLNADNILKLLEPEKKKFVEICMAELKGLGFEVESLEAISKLENLDQVIFGDDFLKKSKQVRKIRSWNFRFKALAATYIFAVYFGAQIVIPTAFTTYQISTDSTQVYSQATYARIQHESTRLHFESADHKVTTGIFVKNLKQIETNKVMILVHGRGNNATTLLPYVEKLRLDIADVDFFSINMRGHGIDSSGGFFRSSTLGIKEAFDVVGAINFLADGGYEEVIVYGHSAGAAAVINALAEHKNLLAPKIKIKGVIVEKTYAHLEEFLRRNHENLFSNFGVNMLLAKNHVPNVIPTSSLQKSITIKSSERIAGYRTSQSNPAESIKKIGARTMVIGSQNDDVLTTGEDAIEIYNNSKHGTLVMDPIRGRNLKQAHEPSFDNPKIVHEIARFINSVM